MKFILSLTLALAVSFSINASHAADGEPTREDIIPVSKAADYKVQIGKMVYEVGNIPQIVEDLNWTEHDASGKISDSVALGIYTRLATAFELVAVILTDSTLSQNKKEELLNPLNDKMQNLMLYVMYNHGEDSKAEVIKKPNTAQQLVGALKEVFLDAKSLYPSKTVNGEWRMGLTDRIQRETLNTEIIAKLQLMAKTVLPEIEGNERLRLGTSEFWQEYYVDHALPVREARVNSQKMAAGLYFLMVPMSLMFPLIDSVGLLSGNYINENSLFASSLLYASAWFTLGVIKWTTIPTRTIKMLKDLSTLLKTPKEQIRVILGPLNKRLSQMREVKHTGIKCANASKAINK